MHSALEPGPNFRLRYVAKNRFAIAVLNMPWNSATVSAASVKTSVYESCDSGSLQHTVSVQYAVISQNIMGL